MAAISQSSSVVVKAWSFSFAGGLVSGKLSLSASNFHNSFWQPVRPMSHAWAELLVEGDVVLRVF